MSDQTQRASIKFNDMQMAFEGSREFVEAMVSKFASANEWPGSVSVAPPLLPESSVAGLDVTELVARKKPRGHHEVIAVLAFALTQGGKAVFGDEDIYRAYIRAGVRPPKIIGQALRDAKNKYQFVERAGKRGRYKITTHGDRVVRFDLPRSGDNL